MRARASSRRGRPASASEYTIREITRAYWGGEDELETGFEAESQFTAYLANRNVDLPNLKVSSRETTDGQVIFEANDVQLDIFPPQYPIEPTCSFTRNGGYQMWEMCDIPFAYRQPRSFWLNVWRLAGWITYHSTGWNTTMPTDTPPGYYTWNRTAEGGWGAQTRLGTTYEWQLTISNGSELWETSGVAPVTATSWTQVRNRCTTTS